MALAIISDNVISKPAPENRGMFSFVKTVE